MTFFPSLSKFFNKTVWQARRCLLSLGTATLLAAPGFSTQLQQSSNVDLALLALEDLMHVEITTVSKKKELWFDSASAVYVITGEDLRRSGYTSIPDALRLAPGIQVANLGSHEWAVSARGFAGLYANKLLVLVDGRSVYTPLNSGVNWDTVDTLLEDVDRIEVVRGPGGTLWGANAVNGVINVITKSAVETQGLFTEVGGGTLERAFGSARYGGKIGDVSFRVYGKYFNRENFTLANGRSARDDWQKGQVGFRLDWEPLSSDLITLQGDFYRGTEHGGMIETDFSGGNILARWSHLYESEAESELQMYYDQFVREPGTFQLIQTFDLALEHKVALGERNHLILGFGYRLIDDRLRDRPGVRYTPETRTVHLPSAFIQDEISLKPDVLRLTLGTKVEHHYFTGWEVQPNTRLLWTPHDKHTVWGAVSRAVRTPSRSEQDVRSDFLTVPGNPPTVYASDMRGRMKSEDVVAYELGYRVFPAPSLSIDLAGFCNVYDNFATFEPGQPYMEASPPPARLVVPFEVRNKAYGETYGLELAARWQATEWWRLDASYTYLQIHLHAPRSREPSAEFAEHESPHHQIAARSTMNITKQSEWDWIIRYVDSIPGFDVPGYITMDVRIAWKPSSNWEISLTGQNLLDDHHPEFGPALATPQFSSEVPRGVYGKLTCRF